MKITGTAVRTVSICIFTMVISLAASSLWAGDIEFGKVSVPSIKKGNPKIQSGLMDIITRQKAPADENEKSSQLERTNGPAEVCGDNVKVYISINKWNDENLKMLENQGVEIQILQPDENLFQASVPLDLIETIVEYPFIDRISLPDYGIANTGSLVTEGDFWARTQEIRQELGLTGIDQSVVVFGDGFDDGAAGDNAGTISARLFREHDLPDRSDPDEVVWCFGWGPNTLPLRQGPNADSVYTRLGGVYLLGSSVSINSLVENGAEGSAMMEVIHDLAPESDLYFHRLGAPTCSTQRASSIELIAARNDLIFEVQTGGQFTPSVIVDPFTFFNTGPYNGTSTVSISAADTAETLLCPYVVPAGNFGRQHWSGTFQEEPDNVNGVNNFRLRKGVILGDETMELDIPPKSTAEVYVLWYDDWENPVDDIDLYILNSVSLDFNAPIASSTDIQGPGFSNPPIESVCGLRNNGNSPYRVSLVLTRKTPSTDPSQRIDIFVVESTIAEKEYIVPAGSIPNNADANSDWVATVGAVNVDTMATPVIESYSGQGPTADGRIKPDFVSFDNVTVNTIHLNPYLGTSAAASHAAGIFALIAEVISPSQFTSNISALRNSALDLGDSGPDNVYGYGLLDAASYVFPNANVNAQATGQYYTSFSTNTGEGWQFGHAASSGLTEPFAGISDGSLYLENRDAKTFGFWTLESPVLDAGSGRKTTLAGKIYQYRCRVSTDVGSNEFPPFRLRIGTVNGQEFANLLIQNGPIASLYPTQEGRDYYLNYLVEDAAFAGQELTLSLDLLGFEPDVPVGTRLYLEEVELLEMDSTY